ncbi:hypothetical protein FOL75_05010 [Bacillus thuringiensis]|nr:hypothetical protein [Bacillus thuringiensis]
MKIKLLSYLIHNVNDSDFLLHREIGKDEVEHQKNENTFQYGGKTFLPLRNCSSEEEAIGFIHLYWNEIKQLNKFEK